MSTIMEASDSSSRISGTFGIFRGVTPAVDPSLALASRPSSSFTSHQSGSSSSSLQPSKVIVSSSSFRGLSMDSISDFWDLGLKSSSWMERGESGVGFVSTNWTFLLRSFFVSTSISSSSSLSSSPWESSSSESMSSDLTEATLLSSLIAFVPFETTDVTTDMGEVSDVTDLIDLGDMGGERGSSYDAIESVELGDNMGGGSFNTIESVGDSGGGS
mmetsp:Transcript_1885/g.3571  ORF Transcript_1885/g.3571 Transcript_1885/m.3571 type:complete len:216 (-) Transcript_1885:19-666(-)